MMNRKGLVTLLGLLCLAALCSCARAAPAQQAAVYQITEFTDSIPLFQDDSESMPRMDFSFSLLDAAGNPDEFRFLNEHLYQGMSPAQYRDAVMRDRQAVYLENRELAASQAPVSPIFDWEYLESMNYTLLNNRAMVLKREIYEYSGGAHGMHAERYFVFDMADRRALYRDDLFRDDAGERLNAIVIDELRRYGNSMGGIVLDEDQGLSQGIFFTDTPGLTDNFFISREGLGLNWEPYEIAPYAAGSIEIILPWRTIRPLLRHDAMELLEKFRIDMFM